LEIRKYQEQMVIKKKKKTKKLGRKNHLIKMIGNYMI
jgi:hypothetical protein